GAVAERAGFGIRMEDDAQASDRFVELRQAHRDIIGEQVRRNGNMHEVGRLNVEAFADVRGVDFYELDRVQLKVLTALRELVALLHFPASDVGSGWIGELLL